MLRFLQVDEGKPVDVMRTAGEALTRGMAVEKDYAAGEINKGSGLIKGFVDVPKNYDGMNAVIDPNDSMFEDIAAGDGALYVPVQTGERFATSEVTGTLIKGDKLVANGGSLVKASSGAVSNAVYDGEYSDPTGISMFIVEIVENEEVV